MWETVMPKSSVTPLVNAMIQISLEQNLDCLIIVHPNLRMMQKKSIHSERKSHCFSDELEFNLTTCNA